ncbi:MAG: hypothetical protein OXH16_12400 [Gemmatimonadetes bacterium]|nr:hypothetical protein [Gemmatimonadota bacterium]
MPIRWSAYVQVTYRDHNGQEKTERGWIGAVGETSFTIRNRNTGKGSIFGLALGLAILAPVAIADARDEDEWQRFATIVTATFISLPIWVLSTIIGATIKSDKWIEVPSQRLNLSIAPTSTEGLRTALTFNF